MVKQRPQGRSSECNQSLQAGSLLIGVLMLGAILTLAIGTGLLLASQSANRFEDAYDGIKLFYAAEGGKQAALNILHTPAYTPYEVGRTLRLPDTLTINDYRVNSSIRVDRVWDDYNGEALLYGYTWNAVTAIVSSEVQVAPSLFRPVVWKHSHVCTVFVRIKSPTENTIKQDGCLHQAPPLVFP